MVNVGALTAGTHFLQLLLEDHGVTNGYDVLITAESFIPGPGPGGGSVPEPVTFALLGIAIAGLRLARWRKVN